METFLAKAVRNGLTRAQAYEVWSRAVELKKTKVFRHLLNRIEAGADWTEITSAARISRLDQAQYQTLRRRFFAYDPR